MARPSKRKVKIKGVYWQTGAWRYKAQNDRERQLLGRLWTRLGKTEEEVYQHYWPMVGSKIGARSGMEDLWAQFERKILPTQAARTRADNIKMWELMRPMMANSHPGDITRQFGIDYLVARGIHGIPPYQPAKTRAKLEFALLRHMLNCAVDWGIIDRNPLLGVTVASYLNIKIRDRVPEIWELQAVKKHAHTGIQLFIDFKYMTGLDQSTCFGLPIPSFTAPGIPVKRSKTNKKGYIEWTDDLVQVCRELIAYNNNRSPFLFCNSLGGQIRVDSFAQEFRKAVRRAIKAGDLAEPFTPNDIRSGHGTDAEELYGLDATKQLLNSEGARKHYVHKRKGDKIVALPRPKAAGGNE